MLNNRTSSWMSQAERGIQPVRRMDVLQKISEALGVTTQTLNPDAPMPAPTAVTAPIKANDLDGARLALAGHPALSALLHLLAGRNHQHAADHASVLPDCAGLLTRGVNRMSLVLGSSAVLPAVPGCATRRTSGSARGPAPCRRYGSSCDAEREAARSGRLAPSQLCRN
ncbi:hypothetical protein ACWEFL_24595 [Streptomyces sp. NPDC004838]